MGLAGVSWCASMTTTVTTGGSLRWVGIYSLGDFLFEAVSDFGCAVGVDLAFGKCCVYPFHCASHKLVYDGVNVDSLSGRHVGDRVPGGKAITDLFCAKAEDLAKSFELGATMTVAVTLTIGRGSSSGAA